MNIIQSYWACNQKDLLFNQPAWFAPEYNLMAWTLSCLQLKKHYNDVALYADSTTAKILIDKLKLPYTEVFCELDALNNYHPELWALPKIYVYSRQIKPFLHVDGDVFIWKTFETELVSNGLIAQNLESATKYYESIMIELEKNLAYFPVEIISERKKNNPILAYNAGIFGGCDTDFFSKYARKAFEFVDKNLNSLSNIKVNNFNIFFEQYLFYCLTKQENKEVGVLVDDVIGDNEYKGFGDFIEVPHNKKYLHTLGKYKKSETVCTQLADRLRLDYPEYYYRIIELYKNSNHNLKNDYYYYLNSNKEQSLLSRQILLKEQYSQGILPVNAKKPNNFITTNPRSIINLPPAINTDYETFFSTISHIQKKKFAKIDKNYLYARDLNVTEYFEYLFADLSTIFIKQLIVEENIALIKSNYDWSDLDKPHFDLNMVTKKPSTIYTALIPECTIKGYSVRNIDLLDIEILNLVKTKVTIGRLLNKCKVLFKEDTSEDAAEIYQKLIFGRIKKAVHYKIIKVCH